jgi:hypothetical protein
MGERMIDFIIFFIFIFVFIALAYDNVRVRMSRVKITEKLLQTTIDNNILRDDISIKNSQEYLNFVTKAREDAYSYIEQVHESFSKFDEQVAPVMDHFNRVGLVASGHPLYDQMEVVSNAYKELKTIFPDTVKND